MGNETELELLITIVVGAGDERTARAACRGLLARTGGRIVESGDCSDEEPGCWSVTISRAGGETPGHAGPGALSRAVRNFMRVLGPEYATPRVSCEPPAAWTVLDNPELVGGLVPGGERLLVEAWAGGSVLPDRVGFADEDPDESEPGAPGEFGHGLDDVDDNGRPRPRLGMTVEVLSPRRAGAEWPARAVASRLARGAVITGHEEGDRTVRVTLDLGPAEGTAPDIVAEAVAALGGGGWSRVREQDGGAMARWSSAPAPPSGIVAVELFAAPPA